MNKDIDFRWNSFFVVLVFPSLKEPIMLPDFDQPYLKK